VGIAPTLGNGTSLNRYETLNVPKAGVALDNRTVAARTIVNEVTGTGTTTIAGPVEVLGQRAHVVVANPNGIIVDAGRFINTGRVALTTGQIGSESRQIAPGVFQENVTATTTSGRITIAGGGLSGQMEAVDLIAHDLSIRGPITGPVQASDAGITLYAGRSSTEFDSAVVPGNTALNWARVTGSGAQNDGSVLVDVSVEGALRANQIGIVVNDLGAGVRIAGDAFATARTFGIDATGNVFVTQGKITGQTGVVISGGRVDMAKASAAAPEGSVSIAATTDGITLASSNLTAQDITFSAPGNLSFTDSTVRGTGSANIDIKGGVSLHGSQLVAAGHLLLSAKTAVLENDVADSQSQLIAQNGALIASLSDDLTVKGGLVQGATKTNGLSNAAGLQSSGAVTINAGRDIAISNDTTTGIIFGSNGDTALNAGGNLTVDQARVITNGDLHIDVAGDLVNWMGPDAGAGGTVIATTTRKSMWWSFGLLRKKVTTLRYAANTQYTVPVLQASGAITLVADRVINQGGEINANGGSLDIKARIIENAAVRMGDMVVNQSCLVICKTKASGNSHLAGGTMNATLDITLTSAESITSTGGTILALGDMTLDAPRIFAGALRLPTIVQRPAGIYSMFQTGGWVSSPLVGGSMTAQGQLTVATKAPVTLAGGSLVAGGGVTNPAGAITLSAPPAETTLTRNSVGLFRALPLMKQ
jgi:filamentous hemagglutinin family protein